MSRNSLTTERARVKFKSELVRTLYYMAQGYNGPHPWGSIARPAYPEFSPVPVKNSSAELELREAIEKVLEDPQWDAICRRLLREMDRKI